MIWAYSLLLCLILLSLVGFYWSRINQLQLPSSRFFAARRLLYLIRQEAAEMLFWRSRRGFLSLPMVIGAVV